MTPQEAAGKRGYEGYCGSTGGVSLISGAELPLWEELYSAIQEAWIAAAEAILYPEEVQK